MADHDVTAEGVADAAAPDAALSDPDVPAGDAGTHSPEQSDGELAPLREQLARATAQRDEYLDLARRQKAELENYKKRVARERENTLVSVKERLMQGLLPVLDDLHRAIEALDTHDFEKTRDGVETVLRSLQATLEREGLTTIDPVGERFDPHQHEALTTQAVDDQPEDTVLQVIQRGYRLGERVIRPARVVVAVAPEDR